MQRTRDRESLPPTSALAAVTVGLLLAGLVGCKDRTDFGSRADLRRTRGVLVISLDTLRADHLSPYGYSRDTSPFLAELADRGVLFEQAIAQYPATLTSHMSLFTGLYPGEHGVYPPDAVLSDKIPTLPELFRAAGYTTGGFTEGAFVAGSYGFARGFDEFNDEVQRQTDDIERTFARAREFLDRLAPEERFFLFVHTYQIHDPYDPPEPYASMFWDGEPPDAFPPDGPNLVRHNTYGGELSPGTVEYFEALYDGSIRYTDDQLKELFAFLDKRGLADDLTVVVLSDHGEQFQEHGQFVHADIYQEVMRVPLIILHPDLPAGRRVSRPVELVDVAPTLLGLARLRPQVTLSGTSRIPELVGRGGAKDPATAYAENHLGNSRAFYLEHEGTLLHVVVHYNQAGDWIGRRFTLDLADAAEAIRVMGWQTPKPATLSLDTGWSQDIVIPAEPADEAFPLPAGTQRRLTVVAHECAPLEHKDNACFAFRILDPLATLTELFDVLQDPREQHDLARQRPELTVDLRRRVMEISHTPTAEPVTQQLQEALEDRLRALGYL
ncbi:MAG: sulfatase [Thermoanaerobaculia bacterium]